MRLQRRQRRILFLAALALAAVGLRQCSQGSPWWNPFGPRNADSESRGAEELAAAYRDGRSGIWVAAEGEVVRLLADDRRGSSHQRFVVRLAHGQTVLVAHNIDLAPRVPVEIGDEISFYGEYEWNDRGGVVHWTHHDPDGGARRGWVRHRGRDYE